jgi:hypothetical protein
MDWFESLGMMNKIGTTVILAAIASVTVCMVVVLIDIVQSGWRYLMNKLKK